MPATNWPSAASFSDCVSRLPQLLAFGLELGLRRQIARDDDAADALAIRDRAGRSTVTMNGPFSTGSTISQVAGASPLGRGRRRSCSASHAASSGPMKSASGRSSSCSRVRPTRLRERLVDVHDAPASIGDDDQVRDRIERILELAPRTHARRRAAAGSRSRSTAGGRARRRGRAGRARRRLRRGRRRTRSCRARGGVPRSGTVTVRGRRVAGGRGRSPRARGAWRRRPATSGSSALTRTPRDDVLGVRRGLQHEMTGAPIVNPDRRAIGAEQPVGAVAEDVEAGRQVQRRGQALPRTRRGARGGRAAARRSAAGGTARAP